MATQDEKVKWVEGTPFMVDGFRFQTPACKHYILTHFHSGLYKSFSAGTIYTSVGTANLIVELIGVNRERVVALEMGKPHMVAGFELTLIDANHCPAAVMFVIRDPRPGGRTSLHTGDFRADESVCTNPLVKSLRGKLDCLYLDTTYCGPRHTFPNQREVLTQAHQLVRLELQRDPNTLFLVGTYSIGKEKVLEAVAKATGSRCLVTSRKARTMRLSGAWDDTTYTTHDAITGGGVVDVDSGSPWYACVRAVPLQDTNSPSTLLGVLAEARARGAAFTSVVGVRPTGWTHTNGRRKAGGGVAGDKAGGVQSSIAIAVNKAGGGGGRGAGVNAGGESPALGGGAGCRSEANGDGDIGGEFESPPDEEDEDQDDEAAAWGGGGIYGEDGDEEKTEEAAAAKETAWAGKKPWVEGDARVYSLPYSEHSSFTQLKDFVRAVRPRKIIPTVNASSPASVEKMLSHFLELMDLSSDRKRLESYFCKRGSTPAESTSHSGGSSSSVCAPFGTTAVLADKKRRKEAAGAAAGAAAEKNQLFTVKGGSLSGGSAEGKLGSGGQLPRREGKKRPRTMYEPSAVASLRPTAADAAGGAAGVESAAGASVAAPINLSGDAAVELHLIDLEAQKAIMADIERRKREAEGEGERGQQGRMGGRPPAGIAPLLGHPSARSTEKRRQAACPDRRCGLGSQGRAVDVSFQAKQFAAAAPKTEGGINHQERAILMDGKEDGAELSNSPMDIRDFFSRRW